MNGLLKKINSSDALTTKSSGDASKSFVGSEKFPSAATAAPALPPDSLIVGAFIMSFASGLLDATTLLAFTDIATTHMSGIVIKAGKSVQPNHFMQINSCDK